MIRDQLTTGPSHAPGLNLCILKSCVREYFSAITGNQYYAALRLRKCSECIRIRALSFGSSGQRNVVLLEKGKIKKKEKSGLSYPSFCHQNKILKFNSFNFVNN